MFYNFFLQFFTFIISTISIKTILKLFHQLGFRRPSAAKTLAGSWGGDQSGRINSSHSVIQEFARSDWMRLSGGDQSERINSSHSVIQEFARFKGLFIYYVITDGVGGSSRFTTILHWVGGGGGGGWFAQLISYYMFYCGYAFCRELCVIL